MSGEIGLGVRVAHAPWPGNMREIPGGLFIESRIVELLNRSGLGKQ